MTIAIFVKVHLVQDVFRTVHYIVAIVFQVSATFKSDVKNLEIRVKRTDLDKVCGSGTCKQAHDIYFLLLFQIKLKRLEVVYTNMSQLYVNIEKNVPHAITRILFTICGIISIVMHLRY